MQRSLAISSITHYEVGIGNKKSHQDYWDSLCNGLTIIPFDELCSSKAIEIFHQLKQKNKITDIADLFIAATAISHEIPLATLNLKYFERIDMLQIINNPDN